MSSPTPAPRRMSLSQVVEALLARGSSEHSSVTLGRNSKGDTTIEVVVRTGDAGEVQTVEEATQVAKRVYDDLRAAYPFGGSNGGGEASS